MGYVNVQTIWKINLFWQPYDECPLVDVRDIYKMEFEVFKSFGWIFFYISAVTIFIALIYLSFPIYGYMNGIGNMDTSNFCKKSEYPAKGYKNNAIPLQCNPAPTCPDGKTGCDVAYMGYNRVNHPAFDFKASP